MMFDQIALMPAIASSAAALAGTMFVAWLGSPRDRYLLCWASALVVIIGGVICFTGSAEVFYPGLQFAAFGLTLVGFALIYTGALLFCGRQVHWSRPFLISAGINLLIAVPYYVGYSGIGAILGNLALAALLVMSAGQYWLARAEAPVPMVANTLLYCGAAVSFVLCAAVMVQGQQWILTERPQNWAEDLNAIAVIVSLTGIGAISLTLNQFRSSRHHKRRAMTDSLTGLLNRGALFETFANAPLEPGMAVVMFDIDHFKAINDTHGHATGDLVLEAFGKLILANLRKDDTAARLGGEEFCVVVPNLSHRSAAAVAERIRASFESAVVASPYGPAQTTVSAGVAIAGVDGEPFETVLRRADDNLYKAKSAGRNHVHAPAPRLVA